MRASQSEASNCTSFPNQDVLTLALNLAFRTNNIDVSGEERQKVVDYLIQVLGPQPEPPQPEPTDDPYALTLPHDHQTYIVDNLHKLSRLDRELMKTILSGSQRKLILEMRHCRYGVWAALNDAGLAEEVVFAEKE